MAERRMFAKTIIDSDAFLDMPLSSQALYFHLSMRADDEGFINNPKKIQRMVGASDDDLRVLAGKRFIIPFESGIVVIKHWKIHNYIRNDRINETKYTDEKALLTVNENGSYSLRDASGEVKELVVAEDTPRQIAYKESTLPYSFTYKMRRAFDGRTCPVCGCRMSTAYKNTTPTIQHNIPISHGGLHELGNISVICLSCNTSIQDNETNDLNNAEVVEVWDKIIEAERQKIDWFSRPSRLDEIDGRQLADNWQTIGSVGKDRLGKDSIGKISIERDKREKNGESDHFEKPKRTTFTPPTPKEVTAYCQESGIVVDAERFCDYYEANGWMVGKNKMKSWKAAARNWARNNNGRQQQKKSDNEFDFDAWMAQKKAEGAFDD